MLVEPNFDKPHRCPRCHAVHWNAGYGWLDLGRCPQCQVYWSYGHAKLANFLYRLKRRLRG